MTNGTDIGQRTVALRTLLKERIGVGGRDFETALRRARWRLPRRLRPEADLIARAERMGRNPKLARRLDTASLDAACNAVTGHLESIDVADVRRGRILGWLSTVVFDLILIAAGFVLWLWWRGYV